MFFLQLLVDSKFILIEALVRVAMMTEDSTDVVVALIDFAQEGQLALTLLKHAITKEVISTGTV